MESLLRPEAWVLEGTGSNRAGPTESPETSRYVYLAMGLTVTGDGVAGPR